MDFHLPLYACRTGKLTLACRWGSTRRPWFKCISNYIINNIKQRKMRDTAISLKFSHDFSVDFPWFLLRISEDSPKNLPLIYLLWIHQKSWWILQVISGKSPKNQREKFLSISTWILVSLTTQFSPWIPLHHVSAIPGDSLQNPCDFARWDLYGLWLQALEKCLILLKPGYKNRQ